MAAPNPIPIKSARMFPLPEWYLPKGTINASDQRLEGASSSCERWGIGFAGIVIAAVIAELIIAWIEPPYRLFLTESAFADAAIAIGIAGEIALGTMWNNHIQTELRRRSDAKVATAFDRAARAETELARITTPRHLLLTPEATVSIVEAIKPFAGTPFTIGVPEVGREAWDLAWHLEPILPKADWVFVDWAVMPGLRKVSPTKLQPWTYGIANVSNVAIEFLPKFADELTPAATALVDALNRIGIAAKVEPTPVSGISGRGNVIHLLIGAKE